MLEHIDDVKQVVDNEEDSKKQKVADAAKIVAPKIFIINVSQILDTSSKNYRILSLRKNADIGN